MKKLVALLLCLMMVVPATLASAENAPLLLLLRLLPRARC